MSHPSKLNLYIAVLAANIGGFSLGSLYSWASPALPKLKAEDSWLPINTDQASWIASLISISSIFGPFIGGVLVDTIGRKGAMIVAVIIGLASWTTLYFASAVWHIYVSRVIGGLGGGAMHCAMPLYIAEIAEDDVRGALGSTFNFSFASGYLLEYVFGPYVSYWNLILISCVAPAIFFIMLPLLPESPYYYIIKDDITNAHKSLKRLRKGWSKENVVAELDEIKESVQQAMKEKGTFYDLVSTSTNRRALLLSCGSMFFQQMSGINVVLFYSETIFDLAGNIMLSASNATIVVAIAFVVFSGAAAPFTKVYGIRNMLISSASIMFIFQTVSAVYFFFFEKGVDVSAVKWLPIINLTGYVLGYSLGYGPLPTAVKGEVFSPNVKGISSAVTVGYSWFMSFVTTKLFPYVQEFGGMYTVFGIFSICSFIGILFSIFIIIDTRDMSLQDIQDILSKKEKVKPRLKQAITSIT